jgi:ABC-type spermidine/putrescine transport system permease subunit I
MQSKKQSIVETTAQVVFDVAGNVFIAVPLAYFLHDIKLEAITEIFFIMLTYNFWKSYVIRRYFRNKKNKHHKFKKAVESS